MKKINVILTALFISFAASSSFAAIKFGNIPNAASNGKDYIGKIVATYYYVEPQTGSQTLRVITRADNKLNENNLINAGTLEFNDKDLIMGMALAANIGKDVAVLFDTNYNIDMVSIITDEYWNGSKK